MSQNQLEQLRKMTTVVADSGEINEIKKYKPTDATTNPSLILKASLLPEYKYLIDDAIQFAKAQSNDPKERHHHFVTKSFVNFGLEILKYVPGRVSTEVDARLSFDVDASVRKGREYISLYEKAGIDRKRVLIKLASTWEGIEAARILEKEGIHCNMTLLFCMGQAVACAEAHATLISPFVGRILDWYKAHTGKDYTPAEDPGVKSVTSIFHYYKKFGYKTQIMGASFRSTGEVLELSGCDLLTIAPDLLKKLEESNDPIVKKLDPSHSKESSIEKMAMNEALFRWMLNEDQMATEKLSEGIRKFAQDTRKLEDSVKDRL